MENIAQAEPIGNSGIFSAMTKIMKSVNAIGKNQKNAQQGFKFRGIDDLYNALHVIMADNGVFCTSEITGVTSESRTTARGNEMISRVVQVAYYFYHTDGSWVTTEVIGEAMDSGDKSASKALSIAHKYALLQSFLIPVEDMEDPDRTSHEPTKKTVAVSAQLKQLAGDFKKTLTMLESLKPEKVVAYREQGLKAYEANDMESLRSIYQKATEAYDEAAADAYKEKEPAGEEIY